MSTFNQQLGVVGDKGLADFIGGLPGYRRYVRAFDNSDELESYLSQSGYGFDPTKPQLFGVLEVRETPQVPRAPGGKYIGDWDIVIHLNATGPGSLDINGATAVNTKLLPQVSPLSKTLEMRTSRIYWSGGLFLSSGIPLPTGGFTDLQSLVYAWVYNSTGAFTLPSPAKLPRCECKDTETGDMTEDLGRCQGELVLLQVLTPHWSTAPLRAMSTGCLGRLSGLFPLSIREVPFPTPAYTEDNFALFVKGVFGLFFTLVFLWPLTRIMKSLTEDKESRINEVMKMMGMPAEGITLGWYATYGLLWMIPSVLIPLTCGTTVFKHSNDFIVFLFFWLFGICVITFCSLLAVFFDRAKTASVVGALAFFLLYFPYVFVQSPTDSVGLKTLSSLCPPVVLSFGASIIAELESAGEGVQWENLGETVDNFSMRRVLWMMIFDACIFAVLAWYLDKVLVVGFGTRKPWYFPCQRRTWQADTSGLTPAEARELEAAFDDEHPENPRYEAVPAAAAASRSVLLRGVTKRFKTQDGRLLTAVQGLTANLYDGQIFCLLGHNGAGKSTTINMLSGMLPMDDGDALMYGRSVRQDMPRIRQILGVCPQHDVIWRELTVREHLLFFARVKGLTEAAVKQEVAQMVLDVGLQEKQNSLAGTLSGGQKRRLSAAIALIGGSRVVFLDEPSSGVDPCSRRELWTCLRQKKVDRTMIMTTHFMDEAEELGDRIAIMAAGQIKCVGSSLFLKASYGVGYTLTITKQPEASQPGCKQMLALRSLISATCPSAEKLSDVGVEVVYRMPMDQSRVFPGLLERFERSPQDYGVDFFSVSVTTLEEVFLRVGQDHTEADMDAQERIAQRSFTRQLSGGSANGDVAVAAPGSRAGGTAVAPAGAPPSSRAGRSSAEAAADSLSIPLRDFASEGSGGARFGGSNALFLSHVSALLSKRLSNAKRDKKSWCCQIGVPLVFLFVALASLKFTGIGSYPSTLFAVDQLPGPQQIVYGVGLGVDSTRVRELLGNLDGMAYEVPGGPKIAEEFDEYLAKNYYRSGGLERYGAIRVQSVPDWSSPGKNRTVPGGWMASGFRTPGRAQAPGQYKVLWPDGFTVPVGTLWDETVEIAAGPAGTITVPLSQLNNRLQVDLFWNSSSRDVVPVLYHELHNKLLRTALGPDTLGESKVKLYDQPFPLTAAQKSLTDTQTSLFLALGFAFVPASYGAFVVLERETNSKHLQIISGVNFVSYWLATWIWDILNYMVPTTLSIILIALFGIHSLTSGWNLFWTIVALMGYGVSCTSFTYMLSFLFQSHTGAQNLLLIVYLFTGGILEIVAIVLALIPSTQELMKNVLVYLFRIMPNYCLADALTNLISRENPIIAQQLGCPTEGCEAYSLNIIGWDLIYMFGGSLLWFSITLFLEMALATPRVRAIFKFRNVDVANAQGGGPEDADVLAERRRVHSGAADGEMVLLKDLRKVFPGRNGVDAKVAVRDMTFGIPEGQCFGYLGMNGAGKTTTMKILTGEELCTSGGAWLGGFDIRTQQQQVRQLLGYCPQFDALIGTLTAREHLMLFARIKGYPTDRIRAYVEALLDQLTLTPYADRQAVTFSGGTRRKLSLGIALVGSPRIVFLDEPTTGVDPESRRFMWKLISTTMQGRSVILTTHSMDECEALCARIGIMVNGRLVCLGSASHLKAVHGSGYQFDVTFQPGVHVPTAYHRLTTWVSQKFPEGGSKVLEWGETSTRAKLRVPKGRLPISAIFREVEQQRTHLSLQEYSISETTLDQIFINFAKHQRDEDTGMSLGRSVGSFEVQEATAHAV